MTNPCWPPAGYEILSKAVSSSDDGGFFVVCHCQQWSATGLESSNAATDALVAHRGESPPAYPSPLPNGGTDA